MGDSRIAQWVYGFMGGLQRRMAERLWSPSKFSDFAIHEQTMASSGTPALFLDFFLANIRVISSLIWFLLCKQLTPDHRVILKVTLGYASYAFIHTFYAASNGSIIIAVSLSAVKTDRNYWSCCLRGRVWYSGSWRCQGQLYQCTRWLIQCEAWATRLNGCRHPLTISMSLSANVTTLWYLWLFPLHGGSESLIIEGRWLYPR